MGEDLSNIQDEQFSHAFRVIRARQLNLNKSEDTVKFYEFDAEAA